MFGWKLLRDSEIDLRDRLMEAREAALKQRIAELETYVSKCEKLIDHERERVTQERERADRLNDAILQQNGLPTVTSTGLNDLAKIEEKAVESTKKHEEFMAELAAEGLGNLYDMSGLELPPDLKEAAKQILGVEVKA